MTTRHKTHNRRSTSGNHRQGAAELRSQVNAVRRDLRDLASAAGDMALDQLDPLEKYVLAKPMKALLLAAGIGACVGFLFRRR
ncbi:MAG TPA: hypothetical protein VJZ71_20805 [Phycisphaerae bacterium]|nr:hypothetical protein [Phycisphaerae bacterium]